MRLSAPLKEVEGCETADVKMAATSFKEAATSVAPSVQAMGQQLLLAPASHFVSLRQGLALDSQSVLWFGASRLSLWRSGIHREAHQGEVIC